MPVSLWLRAETHGGERRAPITPRQAAELVRHGIGLTVEHCPDRAFETCDYADEGATIAVRGKWTAAPDGTVIVGLKELPSEPRALRHRHLYFAHAYKGQTGAETLLARFARGGGALLDLECLIDDDGRRLAAFGHWAGYVGAALAVLQWHRRLERPLRPMTQPELLRTLASLESETHPRVLVIGARGRCGRGAVEALAAAGIDPTRWDVEDTATIDRDALLAHDILLNTVLVTEPVPPFLTRPDLQRASSRLRSIVDVSCDAGYRCNVLPIYDTPTSWDDPVRRLPGETPVDLIAIDNLPSILPRESSEDFSAALLPLLLQLDRFTAPWQRCAATFERALQSIVQPSEA